MCVALGAAVRFVRQVVHLDVGAGPTNHLPDGGARFADEHSDEVRGQLDHFVTCSKWLLKGP